MGLMKFLSPLFVGQNHGDPLSLASTRIRTYLTPQNPRPPKAPNPAPRKINIEPENYSLEDDFPLQMRVLSGSMLIFRGVTP